MNASAQPPESYERFVGRKGDLTVELHYLDFMDGRGLGVQAALLIRNDRSTRAPVYVPLADAWRYAEKRAIHKVAPQLCEQLYGMLTKDGCFRVIDLMMDFMDDLIKSPAPPKRLREDKSLASFLKRCDEEEVTFEAFIGDTKVFG